MNDELPSYEHAVNRDHWILIARHIASRDLCAAVLVCQQWHSIFQSYLWGSPSSHFGAGDDAAYVALTRFKRALSWARLSTRELTHTLHLPPAHAEMYGGPHSDWLRDVLVRLPQLQSLIVHGVPFFDHSALHTVRLPLSKSHSFKQNSRPSYSLRLLDASNAWNATSSGLVSALAHFPQLMYLDLSGTVAAKEVGVLQSLQNLPALKILKLSHLSLKDDDVDVIAKAIKTRVESLDLSDNRISDTGIRNIIANCFLEDQSTLVDHQLAQTFERTGPLSIDREVAKILTTERVGPLAIEVNTNIGVSELNLSGNPITTDAVSELLQTQALRVLDAGSVAPHVEDRDDMRDDEPTHVGPGFQLVVQTMMNTDCSKLSSLRLNHSIVTQDMRNYFRPSRLPRVETLVLTGFPLSTFDRGMTSRLIKFIEECARERKRAILEARVSYSLPPGRNRAVAEREYAKSQFSLQRIVLELSSSSRGKALSGKVQSWQQTAGRSTTEDPDSDALWSAAENDFSFFEEQSFSTASVKEGSRPPINSGDPGRSLLFGHPKLSIDTIAEISRFRSDRKAAFLAAARRDGPEVFVDGYWPGEITVIRDADPVINLDRHDYYGNPYERGWYYR